MKHRAGHHMTEDQLEQEALSWLAELGYAVHAGPGIAHDGPNPQRADYRQVVLPFRLREAIQRLNPGIPTAAREDALQQVLNLGIPSLLSANRATHDAVAQVVARMDAEGAEVSLPGSPVGAGCHDGAAVHWNPLVLELRQTRASSQRKMKIPMKAPLHPCASN